MLLTSINLRLRKEFNREEQRQRVHVWLIVSFRQLDCLPQQSHHACMHNMCSIPVGSTVYHSGTVCIWPNSTILACNGQRVTNLSNAPQSSQTKPDQRTHTHTHMHMSITFHLSHFTFSSVNSVQTVNRVKNLCWPLCRSNVHLCTFTCCTNGTCKGYWWLSPQRFSLCFGAEFVSKKSDNFSGTIDNDNKSLHRQMW